MAYRKAAAADAKGAGHLHWFDRHKDEDDKKKQWVKEKKNMKNRPGIFPLCVPEHLPNSPLCPANSKHASKGTGVCVVSVHTSDVQVDVGSDLPCLVPRPKTGSYQVKAAFRR
jgi:hypothetical protein